MNKQICLLLSSLLCSSVANADISMVYSNPAGDGDMTITVVGNRAAMQMQGPDSGAIRMVFDSSANKMFMLMDDRRQMMDMDSMMKSLGGLSDMLAGMMKDIPEEAQGQLSGLLGSLNGHGANAAPAPAPAAVMTETGQTDTVIGIQCAITNLEQAGQKTEMCMAGHRSVGISDQDFAILQAMMEKQAETAKQAGQLLGASGMEFSPGKLDKVPLRIKSIGGENAGSSSVLQSKSNDVDAKAVAIPEDYQPMNLMGG